MDYGCDGRASGDFTVLFFRKTLKYICKWFTEEKMITLKYNKKNQKYISGCIIFWNWTKRNFKKNMEKSMIFWTNAEK